MTAEATIANEYKSLAGKRQSVLEKARLCAALTKPWLLPPEGQTEDQKLPENYQSLGSRGLTNLEGRLLLSIFPPTAPWFTLDVAPQLRARLQGSPDRLQAYRNSLYLQELIMLAKLESMSIDRRGRHHQGFRNAKRKSLSQTLALGDSLQRLHNNYQLQVFRLDRYVTQRDSSGQVIQHITMESVDSLSITTNRKTNTEIVLECNLEMSTLLEQSPQDRMQELYTRCLWQPQSETWLISSELNGAVFHTSEEPVSPFFATPFELAPEEHYGRGFVEQNLGDVRSVDNLRERFLDYAALATKMTPVRDASSLMEDADLARPTGEPVTGRVEGGKVVDIAYLTVDKLGDMQGSIAVHDRIAKDLSAAMGLESDVQPRKERVTATQVQRIANELETMFGGLYSTIAELEQVPMLRRLRYQMERDGLLNPLPDGAVDIAALTGVQAVRRDVDLQKILQAIQVLGTLNPEMMQRVDTDKLIEILIRYLGIDEPGLIKTEADVQAEAQRQLQQQLAARAGEQAIESTAAIAEQQAAARIP